MQIKNKLSTILKQVKMNEKKPVSFFSTSIPEMNSYFLTIRQLSFLEIVDSTDCQFIILAEFMFAISECNRTFPNIWITQQHNFDLLFFS